MIPITVIKNDGTREIFDKTKIINGVMKSCNKRPVTAQQIQELADDIENTLMGLGKSCLLYTSYYKRQYAVG